MKPKATPRTLAACAACCFTLTLTTQAATVTKAANGTDLTDGASWGGTAPTATDTATWEASSLGAGLLLGSDTSWQGIVVTGGTAAVDISGAGLLTLGTGGVDLSAAAVDLTVANTVVLGADQTWKAAAGRTLTVSGPVSGSANLTAGSAAPTGSHSGYLSAVGGSPTMVFAGATLANITAAGGVMQGGWIPAATPAGTYFFSNNGSEVTYQLQFFDGTHTKVAKVKMTQSGADVVAYQVYAKYKTGNFLGQNFDDPYPVTGFPPVGPDGYGVVATTAVLGTAPAGTVLLSGTNPYTGSTVVASGTLRAGSTAAFGSNSAVSITATPGTTLDLNGFNNTVGSLTGGGTVALGAATLTVGTDNTSPAAYAGTFSGTTGAVVKAGTGTLTLTLGAASDFSQLVVSSGAVITTTTNLGTASTVVLGDAATGTADVQFTTTGASVTRPVTVTANGSGLAMIGSSGGGGNTQFTGVITLDRATTITAGSTDRTSWTGKITGNVGTLTISGGRRTVFESASGLNDFTGSVVVTGTGTVFQIGAGTLSGENIPDASDVTVDSGAFLKLANVGTCIETINALNGSGIVRRHEGVGGTQTLVIGAANGSGSFSGALESGAGPLAVVKAGTGVQTLSGTNPYTGATTITGGTLKLSSGGSINNSASITVAPGATFDASETGFTLGAGKTLTAGDTAPGNDVTGAVVSEGTLRPGGNGTLGTLTGITNLTLGGTLEWDRSANSAASDGIAIDGTLSISSSFNLVPAAVGFPSAGTRSYTVVSGLTTPLTQADLDVLNTVVLPADYTWDTTSDPTALKITHVQAGANLVWSGTGANGNWDTSTANWAGGPGIYQDGDFCTFNDTAAGTTTIDLPADVYPGAVRFNHSALNYSLGSTADPKAGIGGALTLLKQGSGTLTLTSSNFHTGGTTLSDGILSFADGAIPATGPLTMDGGTLRWGPGNTQNVAGVLAMVNGKTATFDTNGNAVSFTTGIGNSSTASLVKTGAGTLTLGGTGTWTGGVEIQQGTLVAGTSGAFGGNLILLGATPHDAAVIVANRADVPNSITVSAAGTGAVIIGADNTGTGSDPATIFGLVTLNRPTTFSGGVAEDRLAIDGRITGNVGTLTIAGGSRTTFLSTLNDFTGDILVTGAGTVLQAGVASAAGVIPDATNITIETDAAFQTAANSGEETVGGIFGSGELRSFRDANPGNLFGSSITIGGGDQNGDFSGVIANGNAVFSVTKTGTGTQILRGVNTYTGNTVVAAGTLHLQEAAALTFRVTNTTHNSLTGAGTVVLDGNFAIDVAAVTATTGTWQLENAASLPGAYGTSFQVVTPAGVPWTDKGNDKWTLASGQLEFTFDETTGTLTVKERGFATWIAGFGLDPADQEPGDDPDHDGLSNLVEYALDGRSPAAADGPAGTFLAGTLAFTKRAEAATDPKLSYQIQESDDLGLTDGWTEAPAGPDYTNDPAAIAYKLPTGKAQTFARLLVTLQP
jgi:autotransporter-associated beta strand protein